MVKLAGSFCSLMALLCLLPVVRAESANDRVQVEALANVSAIQPGKPFWAGIKFTIAPGYHIYWKNPGDSGLATQVKLDLPDGFTAGEIIFPVPTRLQLPGDIVNYAYQGQVMLLVQITPPKQLPMDQSITFNARASWLVCKDDCRPGSAKLSLVLPVAQNSSLTNESIFQLWSQRLPLKQSDMVTWFGAISGEHATLKLSWKSAPTQIQYFPGPTNAGDVENIQINTTGNLTTITFDAKNHQENEALPGLVAFKNASGIEMGLDVAIPGIILQEEPK